MIKDIDLNSNEWCDLIFEGKNKKYGAYYLRKTSSKRHLKALLVVIASCVLFLFIPVLIDIIRLSDSDEYIDLKSVDITSLILLQLPVEDNQITPDEEPVKKEVEENQTPELSDVPSENNNQTQEETLTDPEMSEDSLANRELPEDSVPPNSGEQSNETEMTNETPVEVDSIPEFPGGKSALLRYIYRKIKYPPEAQNKRIGGQVLCTFMINEDGKVSDATLIKGVHPALDEEVLRVLRSMPVWKPAMKSGKAIKVRCFIPVTFKM